MESKAWRNEEMESSIMHQMNEISRQFEEKHPIQAAQWHEQMQREFAEIRERDNTTLHARCLPPSLMDQMPPGVADVMASVLASVLGAEPEGMNDIVQLVEKEFRQKIGQNQLAEADKLALSQLLQKQLLTWKATPEFGETVDLLNSVEGPSAHIMKQLLADVVTLP